VGKSFHPAELKIRQVVGEMYPPRIVLFVRPLVLELLLLVDMAPWVAVARIQLEQMKKVEP